MKIYVFLFCFIGAVLIYAFKLHADKAFLELENDLILEANKDLNLTLDSVIKQNQKEREILENAHKIDKENLEKKYKALNYVKTSKDNNLTRLFNDAILRLQ